MKQVVTQMLRWLLRFANIFSQDRVFNSLITPELSSSNLYTIQTDVRVSEHALASVHAQVRDYEYNENEIIFENTKQKLILIKFDSSRSYRIYIPIYLNHAFRLFVSVVSCIYDAKRFVSGHFAHRYSQWKSQRAVKIVR